MTTRFVDGPAKGTILELQRAPVFLRAVFDQHEWEWDALDQLDDEPKSTETVFVYVMDGEPSRGFACSRGRGGGCRMFFNAEYKLYKEQPSQEELRSTEFWARWTEVEFLKMKSASPDHAERPA